MVTFFFFFRLTCSVLLWGGRTTENKYHWHVLPVIQPHWVCPRSWSVCFPNLHCSGPRLLCRELSEAGPGLYALPRSKPLRFRFSGPPQRLRLGWARVLRPSLVRAAQVTRCLARIFIPNWRLRLIPSPTPVTGFLGVQRACRVSILGCWSLAATLPAGVDHPESQEVMVSREACLQFGTGCLSGAAIAPFQLWLPSPACLSRGWGGPQPALSAQSFVVL